MAASKSLMVGSLTIRTHSVYGGVEATALDGDGHRVAGFERRSITNNTRSRAVPGHRVAAAEHRERAQPFDACRQRTEAGVLDGEAAPDRGAQLAIASH